MELQEFYETQLLQHKVFRSSASFLSSFLPSSIYLLFSCFSTKVLLGLPSFMDSCLFEQSATKLIAIVLLVLTVCCAAEIILLPRPICLLSSLSYLHTDYFPTSQEEGIKHCLRLSVRSLFVLCICLFIASGCRYFRLRKFCCQTA